MIFKILTLLSLIFWLSCKKEVTQEDCENFSMNAYKGIPTASVALKEKCSQFKIKYTADLCQKALVDLIKTGNLKKVQKKYGEPVVNCFTKNDLEKFAN